MTKEETVQVLQSIEDRASELKSPNLTECGWLAISAAKSHLKEEPSIPDIPDAYYMEKAPKAYRDFRERCGITDPVALDEIEEAYYNGMVMQKHHDIIPSKDLGELISNISKRYPEVSFAKLTRIAVQVSKWQKQKDDEAFLLNVARQEDVEQGKDEVEEIVNAIKKATNGTFINRPFTTTLMGCIQEYDKEGRPLHPDPNYFSSSIIIEGVKYAIVKHRWTAYIFKPEYPQADYLWVMSKGKEDTILATVDLTPDYIKERNKKD